VAAGRGLREAKNAEAAMAEKAGGAEGEAAPRKPKSRPVAAPAPMA
jgi:hypothetical protein